MTFTKTAGALTFEIIGRGKRKPSELLELNFEVYIKVYYYSINKLRITNTDHSFAERLKLTPQQVLRTQLE